MKNCKHIFFDLDHTLWDFDKNSSLTFQQIFKENEIKLSFEDFINTYEKINLQYWKLYREDKISKADLRYGRLNDTFKELSFSVSDNLIRKISEEYINYLANHNYLLEGAIDILDYLKPKYQLHIITNGFEEVQHKKMKRSKILDYFSTITTSESAGVKKPNPIIFETALKKASATPENSIMIGDNYEADILGAINFNLKTIYLTKTKTVTENTISIDKLHEITQYL